ncbi:MAG: sigma-54 dependent transcriptional regulator [Desulfuromonadia bacterium]
MKIGTILVIDDEENMRDMLAKLLARHGFEVTLAAGGEEGLHIMERRSFDLILCDIRMPGMDGATFLDQAIDRGVASPIIMMSAYGTIDLAVDCMKRGAYDFISKPFRGDEIVLVIRKAEERERLKAENRRLREEITRQYSFENIVSRNHRMAEIFSLVTKVADYKTTVLIQGESGTGKELIARAIHHAGRRRDRPFVAVNCGAIPEQLLESELFGHVKGAFTDASSDKAGLFEQADGGTLFLDEIGEMPLSLQVKLLRVLQDEEIRRIGGSSPKRVDVRVVSATSRNLENDVAEGRFREDLFFRLNVFSITLPPLRERPEDIPLLVDHFLARFAHRFGKAIPRCDPDAMAILLSHTWPGNVRELENCIERGMVLCDGERFTLQHLPDRLRPPTIRKGGGALLPDDTLSIKKAESYIEAELIRRALEKTGRNRTHAARLLEISHRALLYKMKEYGID